jgi:6-phosphogluconolactonase/glucosamine-6-phosphate isomerase/deaminase
MSGFSFKPADWIPYKDVKVIETVKGLTGEALIKHSNPNFKITILPDISGIWVSDMVLRAKQSDMLDKRCVMILPNPAPAIYMQVAAMINKERINCRNLHIFPMDEWADENGNIAPLDYKAGFGYSMMKYFYGKIDTDLRMPLSNMHFFTNDNINSFTEIICDVGNGGADVCYSGPGWNGHIAFVDPCVPEFAADSVEEFIELGARIVTLHPLTIAQNSLHGVFGSSGNLAAVPPKAATIGPADVKNARCRMEFHSLETKGSRASWQRLISKLVLHGPVTPLVPSSILQLWETNVYVSELIAEPVEPNEKVAY